MFRHSCLLLLLASSLALAEDSDSRNRFVFPPGSTEPAPSATPNPTPLPKRPNDPNEAIALFFKALTHGQIDAAYDVLTRGTVIADRAGGPSELKERTRRAFDTFGAITGYETIDSQTVGASLLRITCISLNTELPLRWRFYFYKTGPVWHLVDLRVDDALGELFNESSHK